jgi:diketogulonate reductase-like aldo/keto reductase
MPEVGFGTWRLRGDQARASVREALSVGYRHIDTATMYGNEEEIGQALADSGADRADIFLTTKIPPLRYRQGALGPAAVAARARHRLPRSVAGALAAAGPW